MIKHIQDAISYGLFEDFRAEDSTLVAGFHECFGEQLDCEDGSACCVWLRSARVGGSRVFCMVNTSGSASIDIADYSRGVALGFCI